VAAKTTNEATTLTAVVWQEGDWYVSQCVELGVASQGRTERAALRNLKQAVLLYLADDRTGEVKWPVKLERKVLPLRLSA
jgi:predicted RNase H-like HicB family nuclease